MLIITPGLFPQPCCTTRGGNVLVLVISGTKNCKLGAGVERGGCTRRETNILKKVKETGLVSLALPPKGQGLTQGVWSLARKQQRVWSKLQEPEPEGLEAQNGSIDMQI